MLLNCKFCGGELLITGGERITSCKYCHTAQTLPKAEDESLHNLFNRANALRRRCEFDKAEAAFEKIIEADGTEAEAYYGLVLSKYGIEYVDDKATGKMLPTCHRASYDSVIADEDYKSALEYADSERRALYEEQAKEIDRIQKEILALAQKEETYDVFICYKETDENGRRTRDSVIANEIYYQLTDASLKVFYAAVTLENKLGKDYEPIIFAALNSAKVMLVVGSKPEYFNAVWVKNEWSRYLKIMKKDRKKLLIPCYRDMDAYDLPDEFAHLQAQNMEKIGFITDLIRGIKKVIESFKKNPEVLIEKTETVIKEKETVVKVPTVKETAVSGAGTTSLLKRVFAFLEDGEFDSADEYCERVLDIELENADAYLGKLMAELKIKKREQLKDVKTTFDIDINYKKAIRYGDEALKKELNGYIEEIKKRNEFELKESVYSTAVEAYKLQKVSKLKYAKEMFESISGFKDSDELALSCEEQIKKIAELERVKKKEREERQRAEAERLAELERIRAEKRKKIIKKTAIIGIPVVCIVLAVVIAVNLFVNFSATTLDFRLSNSGDSYEIYDIGDYKGENLEIPNKYKGKPVTQIKSKAFYFCKELKSVTIPENVTGISRAAFYKCPNLTSIKFEDTSNWYIVDNYTDFVNKTNGKRVSVGNPLLNSDYFKGTYYDYYWYKK